MNKRFSALTIIVSLVLVSSVLAAFEFGDRVVDSFLADNPENILDVDDDFAVLKPNKTVTQCPEGDITVMDGKRCWEQDSNTIFKGWIVVDFNGTTFDDVQNIEFNASELDLNCNQCNNSAQFQVFITDDLNGTVTDWDHVGQCVIPDDTQGQICTFNLTNGTSVDAYVVGRSAGKGLGTNKPDPAIHWGRLTV